MIKICFLDSEERIIKASISNISQCHKAKERFIMIKNNLLLIPGENQISIINIEQYKLVRKIEVPGANWIYGVCMINKNMLFTGDQAKIIRQWKIEGDNLILISKKEKAHEDGVNVLINIGNKFIAAGSNDKKIKIWKIFK